MSKPYFIDSNIFIYSKGKEHPLKSPCINILQKIYEGNILTITNTEILQEILYHFQSIKKIQIGIQLAKEVIRISYRILPVIEKDLSQALMLLEKYPKLGTRDAFHSATMINNDIKEIISTDSLSDLFSEITRIDPQIFKLKSNY